MTDITRRDVLQGAAAVAGTALAGCAGGESDDPDDAGWGEDPVRHEVQEYNEWIGNRDWDTIDPDRTTTRAAEIERTAEDAPVYRVTVEAYTDLDICGRLDELDQDRGEMHQLERHEGVELFGHFYQQDHFKPVSSVNQREREPQVGAFRLELTDGNGRLTYEMDAETYDDVWEHHVGGLFSVSHYADGFKDAVQARRQVDCD